MNAPRPVGWICGSILLFAFAAVLLPWIGPGSISLDRVLARTAPDYPIFVELRVSRTLLGLLAGGALALTGSLFQSMLRDSLASPYTLGVSAGASFGAVFTFALGLERLLGFPASSAGAMGSTGCSGDRRGRLLEGRPAFRSPPASLRDCAQQYLFPAFILLIDSVVHDHRTFSIVQWLIGSVDTVSYRALFVFAVGDRSGVFDYHLPGAQLEYAGGWENHGPARAESISGA